jgi:hypothetical protein
MRKILILLTVTIIIIISAYYLLTSQAEVAVDKQSKNNPPTVNLIYPKGGEELSGIVEISWISYDDSNAVSITIQYTSDPEPFCPSCPPQQWHDIALNLSNNGSFKWDTTKIKNGRYMIKVIASDGAKISEAKSGWIIINNG